MLPPHRIQLGRRLLSPRVSRAVLGGLGVASLAVGSTGTYLASQWNKTTEVGLEDVLADFREGATDTTTGPGEAPAALPGEVPVETVPVAGTDPAAVTGGVVVVGPTAPAVTEPVVVPEVPTGPAPFVRPEEGVYRYAATGGEQVSVGGSHSYPGEVYATLTHTACGFHVVVQVLEEHVDTLDFCIDGTRLLFQGYHERMVFLGNVGEGEFLCEPDVVAVDKAIGPGTTQAAECVAGSFQASGTMTHTGDAPFAVDGTEITGSTVDWQWTATGTSSGSGQTVWDFDPNGLPLRIHRVSTTSSPTILGQVTHHEDATFTLQSRTPLR